MMIYKYYYLYFINAYIFFFILYNITNLFLLIGDWGLGIGDWGLGIGPNPQSPIPIYIFLLVYFKIIC